MKIKKEQIYLRWTYETKLNSKYPIQGYEIEIYGKPTIKNSNIIIGQCESIIGSVTTGEYSNWDYEEKKHQLEYTIVTNEDTYRFVIYLLINILFNTKTNKFNQNKLGSGLR